MFFSFDFTEAQWIVLFGTFLTGIGTIITAWTGIVRAKKETRTDDEIACLDRLKVARLDEEAMREELRVLKRKYESA